LLDGRRSFRKKVSSIQKLLFFKKPKLKPKPPSVVPYEFQGKHREDDGNPILFSHGNITRKPFLLSKRSRCNNYNEENGSNTDQEEEMPKKPKKPKKTSTYLDASSALHAIITIPANFKNKMRKV
ncbi:hypothetical protein ACH5RR_034033, partial [Cinchona calisaya]